MLSAESLRLSTLITPEPSSYSRYRPPSPASESAVESGEESEAELADIGATGIRDRDPPTTTLSGDAYRSHPQEMGQEQKRPRQRHRLPLSV